MAPSRVAQRVMAELLHANLARHGLAFSVFSINGAIDEPKMRAMYKKQAHVVLHSAQRHREGDGEPLRQRGFQAGRRNTR